MTKHEFLNQLKSELSGLPDSEINDILRDQEEYFADALSSGRQEAEVLTSLGQPRDLARELKANQKIKTAVAETKLISKAEKVLRAIGALCVLAPFNLILVLGPFIAVCGVIFAFWCVAGSLALITLLGAGLSWLALPAGLFVSLTLFFGSLAGTGFSVLALIACYLVTYWFLKATLSYLKWNIQFITGEKL